MAAEVLEALKPRPAAVTRRARSVGWSRGEHLGRVRRQDGCLGAIAMAPRFEAAAKRLAEKFADDLKSGAVILRKWPVWIPAASCDGVLLDLA